MNKLAVAIMSFLLAFAVAASPGKGKGKEKRGPSDSAYQHADERASFKREGSRTTNTTRKKKGSKAHPEASHATPDSGSHSNTVSGSEQKGSDDTDVGGRDADGNESARRVEQRPDPERETTGERDREFDRR